MKLGKILFLLINGVLCTAIGAVVETPMPNPGAIAVHGSPQLFWNVAAENILSNGRL